MPLLIGFLLVLLAALLQGTFVLPMTLVRQWSWEHTWAAFSLLGMFVFNWIITFLLVPNIFAVYSASPVKDLAVLALFGLGWGVGAVLFGLGMERLGMALGYPIIMGLIASLGALIPLLLFFPQSLFTSKGLFLLAGMALVIFGIALCSIAGTRRTASEGKSAATRSNTFKIGLAIAIFAGVLSCLPNVGMAFGGNVIQAAASLGASNATTFRRVVLPALRPAILSGAALAFARAVGEFGSIVLLAGKVQIASLVIFADIESDAQGAAASVSVVLLVIALAILFALRRFSR